MEINQQVENTPQIEQPAQTETRYTRFCFGYAKQWGQAYRCSWQQFNDLLDSKSVQSICSQIALISKGYWKKTQPERDAIDDQKKKYKAQLPFIAVHSQYFADDDEKNAHRCNACAEDNGCGMLDIDHVPNPREIWNTITKKQIADNHIIFASITPSGFGLRVIAERNQNETIVECQHRLAALFGIDITTIEKNDNYDKGVHDPARISYVTPRNYVLHIDEEKICSRIKTASLQKQGAKTQRFSTTTVKDETNESIVLTPCSNVKEQPTFTLNGTDIPYSLIVNELIKLVTKTHGEFKKNNRHNIYIELCRDLRVICNNNPDTLCQIIPNKSLDDEPRDLPRVARDACAWRTAPMSPRMYNAIHNAMMITCSRSTTMPVNNQFISDSNQIDTQSINGQLIAMSGAPISPWTQWGGLNGDTKEGFNGDGTEDGTENEPEDAINNALATFQALPLPRLFETMVGHLRDTEHRAAAVISALPVLGTLATGVRFMYHGNEEQALTFQTMVLGSSGKGKSQIHKPAKTLARQLMDESRKQELQEDNYRNRAIVNDIIAPQHNAIRVIYGETTTEAFLHYQKACAGKHQLLIVSEYANFVGKNTKDFGADSAILRAAFDNDIWSRTTKSVGAVNGSVNVFFNILAAMVDDSVDDFFTDKSIKEGSALRWSYAYIQHRRTHDDVEPYTTDEQNLIDAYAAQLMQIPQHTWLDCPWINRAVANWKQQKQQLRKENKIDDSQLEIAERCEVIACRAGYAAALLYNCARRKGSATWPNETLQQHNADFALWVADYTFAVQCHFFLQRKRALKHNHGQRGYNAPFGYKQQNINNNRYNTYNRYDNNNGRYSVHPHHYPAHNADKANNPEYPTQNQTLNNNESNNNEENHNEWNNNNERNNNIEGNNELNNNIEENNNNEIAENEYIPSDIPSNHSSYNSPYNPSDNPSYNPTYNPSDTPSHNPSYNPTYNPSDNPSNHPSYNPSDNSSYIPYIPPKVAELLSRLPEEFTWDNLKQQVLAMGGKDNDNAMYNRLNNYKKQGFITQPDPNHKIYRKRR